MNLRIYIVPLSYYVDIIKDIWTCRNMLGPLGSVKSAYKFMAQARREYKATLRGHRDGDYE